VFFMMLVACSATSATAPQREYRVGLAKALRGASDEGLTTGWYRRGYDVGWAEAVDVAVDARLRFTERGCLFAASEIRRVRPDFLLSTDDVVCAPPSTRVLSAVYHGPKFESVRASLPDRVTDAFDIGYEFGFRRGVYETDLPTAVRRIARDACVSMLAEENAVSALPDIEGSIARCESFAARIAE
jgi:hypothetical protein